MNAEVYFLILFFYSVNGRPQPPELFEEKGKTFDKCGYQSCPKIDPTKINVHLVPHTHDDVGWLKTVDQYYYGSATSIQKAGVQYIIDSVIQQLLEDPKKKFIYVESAFFFKWWKEQTKQLQDDVKMLVNEGRLEFIGGAWSMNDEATTHYQSVIDQFAWGLRLLNDTFGKCGRPKIGWQIDPFGHSREMASMFAQMGYDGLFFGRLDEEDKLNRLIYKNAEMIWKGSPDNLGESSDLFTGALYNQYQPPPGFCFDILCSDKPIIDDKHSPEYNVNSRLTEFIEYIETMSVSYKTNNVLITMGEDFHYQAAHMWYKNLDKLIKYGNENDKGVNLFYSTPSCYLKALHESNQTWPTKEDDFFPYGSDKNTYWTGYYTSRPTLKRYERIGNNFLQVCKQLTALAGNNAKSKEMESHLNFLRETMGIMQHHDAVTGTEKQKVAFDYAKRLDVGLRACASNTRIVLNQMFTGNEQNLSISEQDSVKDSDVHENLPKRNYTFDFNNCLLLNISVCDVSEKKDNFMITVYNPLVHSTFQYIRIPVTSDNYEVKDYRGVPTLSQVLPVPSTIKSLKFRHSSASYELVFMASELPPMGYKSFYIKRLKTSFSIPKLIKRKANETVEIENNNMKLSFNENGFLSRITTKDGVNESIKQEILYYEGANGDNTSPKKRASGAYIFRPNPEKQSAISISKTVKLEFIKGPLVEEVHQIYNTWISQVIRLYREDSHAEFEWLVGGIPVEDKIGKEIITRFSSEIKSNSIFYTDSNGREMIKRKRDHRDTWNYTVTEKIAGNYYPLTTKIALEDDSHRMAILVDRAQGGSSIQDGALEIMVHRRLLKDDAFGVGEPLNETAYGTGLVARGQHYLVFGKKEKQSPTLEAQERFLQMEKLLPAWTFFADVKNYTFDEWKSKFYTITSGVSLPLPKNIHLMTYEPWHENELLIRFEHLLEKNEDPEYSKPVTFHFKDVFRNLQVENIRETTLDGNQWLDETKRLKFNAEKSEPEPVVEEKIEVIVKHRGTRSPQIEVEKLEKNDQQNYLPKEEDDKFILTLNPMQIRTFIVTLAVNI